MKYAVLLSRQAEKSYKKLQGEIKNQIQKNLLGLENQFCTGKQLHGDLKENFSLHVGKLRIIYTLSEKDKTIYIIAIGPRKTIYQ